MTLIGQMMYELKTLLSHSLLFFFFCFHNKQKKTNNSNAYLVYSHRCCHLSGYFYTRP